MGIFFAEKRNQKNRSYRSIGIVQRSGERIKIRITNQLNSALFMRLLLLAPSTLGHTSPPSALPFIYIYIVVYCILYNICCCSYDFNRSTDANKISIEHSKYLGGSSFCFPLFVEPLRFYLFLFGLFLGLFRCNSNALFLKCSGFVVTVV